MAIPPPGEVCQTCGRKMPHEHDSPPRKKRSKFIVNEPQGEEGLLDELLIDLMEKYEAAWLSEGPSIGERNWKFHCLHDVLLAVRDAPADVIEKLMPSAVGG